MCGIAGIMGLQGPPSQKTLIDLQRALAHRGPDDQGNKVIDMVGLVHTRLSIIDVAHGHQPLTGPDGTVVIVNGEIYNHVELRTQFRDFPYQTTSDSESVLPLYQKYGPEGVGYLRGMFGLALYDPGQKHLILSRDPFGIKPLYYMDHPKKGFAFASEAQALRKLGWYPPSVDPESRKEFLELRYTTYPETLLPFIYRLLPGETIVVQKGQITQRHRVSLYPQKKPDSISETQALEDFDRILSESVKVHLRSDVPYGLFLSSGLDSSLVLSMMARHTSQPIKTFTVGFSGSNVHDERDQARRLAHHFKTDHTEMNIEEKDFWPLLPQLVATLDDPAGDPAIVPTFILAQKAKESVKVVLCGEGGDEMFAGYRRYQKTWLPTWLGGGLIRQRGRFKKEGIRSPHVDHWNKNLERILSSLQAPGRSKIQLAQWVEMETWLPNYLLTKLDRCLMAHGVEGRTPFLDREVAQFAYHLPDHLKIRRGFGKWILRKWMEKNLPLAQPFAKKKGFSVPIPQWIAGQADRLGPLVAHQAGIKEVFRPQEALRLFQNPRSPKSFIPWSLLFYALWHQIHVLEKPLVHDPYAMLAA